MASQAVPLQHGPHAAGIFADMTVDGPEIGTLVLVIDRAKNLPNRRSMGKQSAYCAARVGKEAKKTETDKRGGQTPKWDQELRFTIHESPDYQQFKLSVFSEDKRTDLVGEAWVSLIEVVVPGGGKSDLWQPLMCKGKYAGEIRIELTYYDARPKPEKAMIEDELRSSVGGSRVKRRPLPTNPASGSGSLTPNTVGEVGTAMPGRAKHGPRDFRTPGRANSLPPESAAPVPLQSQPKANSNMYGTSPQFPAQHMPPDQYYEEPEQQYHTGPQQMYHDEPQQCPPQQSQQLYNEPYQQPDFLPQLPPSSRHRESGHQRTGSRQARPGQPALIPPRPQSHMSLPHSQSMPIVPSQHRRPELYDEYQQGLSTDFPEPIPDMDYQHQQLRQRRTDVPPGWQEEYDDPYNDRPRTAESDGGGAPPPPPPMHSISAPAVPQYATSQHSTPAASPYHATQPNGRHNSVPNASSLQQLERRYGNGGYAQQTPSPIQPGRGRSTDFYAGSPTEHSPYGSPAPPSPYGRSPGTARSRQNLSDQSYNGTPSSRQQPHPLSQEVPRPRSRSPMPAYAPQHARAPSPNTYVAQPRSRSPLPYTHPRAPSPQPYAQSNPPYQADYQNRSDGAPMIKPRAISPRPPPLGPIPDGRPTSGGRSSYSLQFPVRAFESGDNSPLSTSQRGLPSSTNHTTPRRKLTSSSASALPSPLDTTATSRASPGSVPFSPDDFAMHNPNSPAAGPQEAPRGPIVNWHGQEIDPSDHLPVDSWAPEPKKKTPTKTYGLGRDRDFGPRTTPGGSTSGARAMGRDNVITVRMKSASASGSPAPASSASAPRVPSPLPSIAGSPGGGRNRLVKNNNNDRPHYRSNSAIVEPLAERHNFNGTIPDPYAQGQGREYSSSGFFGNERGGLPPSLPPKIPVERAGSGYEQRLIGGYGDQSGYGGHGNPELGYAGDGGNGYDDGYGDDALAREIGSIDIGGASSPYGSGRETRYEGRTAGGTAGAGRGGYGSAHVAYVPVKSQRDRGPGQGSYY
ncbi:hypothetical protein LTR62_008424 [Meristemomyces frigidus]|uniref:C2 domain-containing protein n=1 Tax=Meristemomyces frigidus TaxID=1508187 RepID=A0AAN7TAN9_9PEZI|nr:hypothetical protein LTR62_008424 [Meristemomyces frigidus]